MANNIKLALVGSRDYHNYQAFASVVDNWITRFGRPELIISGGAAGVDSLAEIYAREHSIPTTIYLADWSSQGKRAGPIRNTQIVEAATHVIAFPSRQGRGTQDTIRKASHLPTEIHYVD